MHQKGAVSTLKDLYIIYEKIKINISFTCNYLQKYRYIYIYIYILSLICLARMDFSEQYRI